MEDEEAGEEPEAADDAGAGADASWISSSHPTASSSGRAVCSDLSEEGYVTRKVVAHPRLRLHLLRSRLAASSA
jgi:hypothetical protein